MKKHHLPLLAGVIIIGAFIWSQTDFKGTAPAKSKDTDSLAFTVDTDSLHVHIYDVHINAADSNFAISDSTAEIPEPALKSVRRWAKLHTFTVNINLDSVSVDSENAITLIPYPPKWNLPTCTDTTKQTCLIFNPNGSMTERNLER